MTSASLGRPSTSSGVTERLGNSGEPVRKASTSRSSWCQRRLCRPYPLAALRPRPRPGSPKAARTRASTSPGSRGLAGPLTRTCAAAAQARRPKVTHTCLRRTPGHRAPPSRQSAATPHQSTSPAVSSAWVMPRMPRMVMGTAALRQWRARCRVAAKAAGEARASNVAWFRSSLSKCSDLTTRGTVATANPSASQRSRAGPRTTCSTRSP